MDNLKSEKHDVEGDPPEKLDSGSLDAVKPILRYLYSPFSVANGSTLNSGALRQSHIIPLETTAPLSRQSRSLGSNRYSNRQTSHQDLDRLPEFHNQRNAELSACKCRNMHEFYYSRSNC
jgi:hypothetical protein